MNETGYLILSIVMALVGLVYAIWPQPLLKRKYQRAGEDEVPKIAILTSRITGVVCVIAGIVLFVKFCI